MYLVSIFIISSVPANVTTVVDSSEKSNDNDNDNEKVYLDIN